MLTWIACIDRYIDVIITCASGLLMSILACRDGILEREKESDIYRYRYR